MSKRQEGVRRSNLCITRKISQILNWGCNTQEVHKRFRSSEIYLSIQQENMSDVREYKESRWREVVSRCIEGVIFTL